jgi:hypothetical protein
MKTTTSNLAIAEPPVRPATTQRERANERESAHASELAMLRERVRRMRMPRGEFMPHLSR